MYHRDLARTGNDGTGAASGSPSRAWTSPDLDGDVYGEPLVLADRVLVVTQNNTVYAFAPGDGHQLWSQHLGEPVPRSSLPCGNIDLTGIISTPVVDTATGLVYVVTFSRPARHELVALEAASGGVRFRRPIDPPGADPRVHQQRSALALSLGIVYVAYGGLFGDCGQYHGWVMGARADGSGDLIGWMVPVAREGGIWAPPGPAVSTSGDLFVATGNGELTDEFAYGDAVVRLTPDLKAADYFAPADWPRLDQIDADLGSSTPALLDGGLVFQIGKGGTGYLLRADNLGKIGGQLASASICRGGYGGTAYAPPVLFVPCSDGLSAVRISAQPPGLEKIWQSQQCGRGSPIVSKGRVWVIDYIGGKVCALEPATGDIAFQEEIGTAAHFATPSAGGGKVYVASLRHLVAFNTP